MSRTATPPKRPFASLSGSGKDALSTRQLGHLLRRTAFGVSVDRVERWGGEPAPEVIDELLSFSDDDPMQPMLDQMVGLSYPFQNWSQLQEWWCFRMLNSPTPLQERLTLMWHNHFATSLRKVRHTQRMETHLNLLRQHAAGNFRTLLIEISKDPAMLIWLDGQHNLKGKPNENYAREILELFTMGVGQYEENDIGELARALTGWRIHHLEGKFEEKRFDEGEKTIFGETGDFNLEGAVDLILKQPPVPRFLARRLLTEFVHPEPTAEHVDHVASRITHHKYELKPVLRELLNSELFFSDWAYRAQIKSPATLVIGTLLAMGGKPYAKFARESMARMGQELLMPPDVSGWAGGEDWVNATTALERFNFGMAAATNRRGEFAKPLPLMDYLRKKELTDPDAIMDHFALLLLDGELPDDQRGPIREYMQLDRKNKPADFKMEWRVVDDKVRGMVHLMTTLPEYQLA